MTRLTQTLRSISLPASTRLLGATLLVAALSTATLSAWAQPVGGGPGMYGGGMGMQGGGPGMHGGGPGMHGGGMGMMQGRGLERMLDSVNATAEQRTQIKAIAERARADMQAQHEAGKGAREQMAKLFAQPTVDANAVEALRAQQMQRHDQASRRMTQAMVEASRVLTPEQRKQIAERMGQRRAMMERHQHERRALDGGASAPR
jgi:Spy/CpxP family protein refolding chaperone